MPRPQSLKPAYCHHKASGRAFVTLDGKRIDLGAHHTQESRDRFDTEVAAWVARGRRPRHRGYPRRRRAPDRNAAASQTPIGRAKGGG